MKKVILSMLLTFLILNVMTGCRENTRRTNNNVSTTLSREPISQPKAEDVVIDVEVYDEKIKVVESPTTKGDIPQNMDVVYGMVEERECAEKWENSLIRQYKALFMAMATLDFDAYRKYFYSYAIEYCQKHYEHLSTERRLMDNFMEEMKPLEEYINNLTAAHLNVNAVVPAFIRRVECNDELFVAFQTSINICTDKVYTHQKQCIPFLGISSDGGKHWSFMAYDETADIILKSKYSIDVVDTIMGY